MKKNSCTLKKILLIIIILILPVGLYAENNSRKKAENKIITLTAQAYDKEISKGVVLVDYWAVWCGPCRKMEPVLKQIANETKVKVAKLNVDDYKAFVGLQKINSIPTMIIYKDGVEVQRLTGVYSKQDLLKILEPLI